jgi:ABC-type multidrug transport system ATPase subunit
MIQLNKVFLNINQKEILSNISLKIKKNSCFVIMGKNGSGKSTLLKIINQLILPTRGKAIFTYDASVPMLFQKPIWFDNTVDFNFQILQKIKKHQTNYNWYKKFGLDKINNQKFTTLSGGEKQKVFLSRIMSFDQDIIMMDEPNQSLDLQNEKLLLHLLNEEKKHKTLILTLHDFELAKQIADEIIYLDKGKIRLAGSNQEFFTNFHKLMKKN